MLDKKNPLKSCSTPKKRSSTVIFDFFYKKILNDILFMKIHEKSTKIHGKNGLQDQECPLKNCLFWNSSR